MSRKLTWVDVPLLLVPGVLLRLLALAWQGHEAAREMSVWSLGTFLIYVSFYIATRLLLPRGARTLVFLIVVAPAVLSFLTGGVSLAAGYAIWAFASAPLFGILFGAAFMPKRRHWPASPPVSA
jgi:hypothetical protein